MTTTPRLAAKVVGTVEGRKVRHYVGFPPQLTGGRDLRCELPPAWALLIHERPSGVFLIRYSREGKVVGDTWHRSVQEAKEQADFEFEGKLSNWTAVPADVEDIMRFLGS